MVGAAEPWLSGQDLKVEPHLRAVMRAYLHHGPFLRATADAQVGPLSAASERYRAMMAMWDEAVAERLAISYPWLPEPRLSSHALNAAGERIMYYDLGGGVEDVGEEQFERAVGMLYGLWCDVLGIRRGSEECVR